MATMPPQEPYDLATAAANDHGTLAFPWPPAPGHSLLDAFVATWRGASFGPRAFFDAMPRATGYGAALLYYLAIGVASAGAALFWRLIGEPFAPAADTDLLARLGIPLAEQMPLLEFLFAPALLLLLIVLAAGTTHALLAVLGGANGDFRTTAKVFAFSYSPQLFTVIPIVGAWIGTPWMVALAIIGLRHAHATDRWRAILAVIGPLALLFGFYVMALFAAMGSMIIG